MFLQPKQLVPVNCSSKSQKEAPKSDLSKTIKVALVIWEHIIFCTVPVSFSIELEETTLVCCLCICQLKKWGDSARHLQFQFGNTHWRRLQVGNRKDLEHPWWGAWPTSVAIVFQRSFEVNLALNRLHGLIVHATGLQPRAWWDKVACYMK